MSHGQEGHTRSDTGPRLQPAEVPEVQRTTGALYVAMFVAMLVATWASLWARPSKPAENPLEESDDAPTNTESGDAEVRQYGYGKSYLLN